MSEKEVVGRKVVGRNVAIALGIICIILAVGLLGAIVIISGKDNTITSLNSQITEKDNIISLKNSTVWVNNQTVSQYIGPGGFHWWTSWTFSAGYAGYVSVNVTSSTTNNTYAQVIWCSTPSPNTYPHGISYDSGLRMVGTSGTAYFPILPSSSIEIRVGNTNPLSGATETVTITYHY